MSLPSATIAPAAFSASSFRSDNQGLVFSGVQPTGDLHVGNLLGALLPWASMQNDYACIYCVVDLHALTRGQPAATLQANSREVAAGIIAAGINPQQSILFRQSQNQDHAELGWILTCLARYGWLSRMTQFKEKSGKRREEASAGLFTYPALMAADILAYKATHVPVGQDQKQHLELCRDVAHKFNHDYESPDFFPLPEPVIQKTAARIMSLRDASKKMAKSKGSEGDAIFLRDSNDQIRTKIRKAKSDSYPLPETIEALETRPEAYNLVQIMAALLRQDLGVILSECAGRGFREFKESLADGLISLLEPIRSEINQLLRDPVELDRILNDGAEKSTSLSNPVLREIRERTGLGEVSSTLPRSG